MAGTGPHPGAWAGRADGCGTLSVMTTQQLTTAVAVAGLALGLVNLWYAVLRPWWGHRKAEPVVSFEAVHFIRGDHSDGEERLAVTNRGPAAMRDVQVELYGPGDGSLVDMIARNLHLPIEVIHPEQTIHIRLHRSMKDDLRSAELHWKDGRRAINSRRFWLSLHTIV